MRALAIGGLAAVRELGRLSWCICESETLRAPGCGGACARGSLIGVEAFGALALVPSRIKGVRAAGDCLMRKREVRRAICATLLIDIG